MGSPEQRNEMRVWVETCRLQDMGFWNSACLSHCCHPASQLEALGTAQGCLGLRRPAFPAPRSGPGPPQLRQAAVCLPDKRAGEQHPHLPSCAPGTGSTSRAGDRVQRPAPTQLLAQRGQLRGTFRLHSPPHPVCRALGSRRQRPECAGQRHCPHLVTAPGLPSHPAVPHCPLQAPCTHPGCLQENWK